MSTLQWTIVDGIEQAEGFGIKYQVFKCSVCGSPKWSVRVVYPISNPAIYDDNNDTQYEAKTICESHHAHITSLVEG